MQVAITAAPPNHETLHSQKTEKYTIIFTDTENRPFRISQCINSDQLLQVLLLFVF